MNACNHACQTGGNISLNSKSSGRPVTLVETIEGSVLLHEIWNWYIWLWYRYPSYVIGELLTLSLFFATELNFFQCLHSAKVFGDAEKKKKMNNGIFQEEKRKSTKKKNLILLFNTHFPYVDPSMGILGTSLQLVNSLVQKGYCRTFAIKRGQTYQYLLHDYCAVDIVGACSLEKT